MLKPSNFWHVRLRGEQFAVQGHETRPPVNDGFIFEVHHKELEFRKGRINQFWLDRRSIFPTRGRKCSNYVELLRYALERAQGLPGGLINSSVDQIGLAALMPHIRDFGANRVISDAALLPSQQREVGAQLESLLLRPGKKCRRNVD